MPVRISRAEGVFAAAAVVVLVVLVATVGAQFKDPVKQGTSPDDAIQKVKDANKGKWNEEDSLSGAMSQILQAVLDPIGQEYTRGPACRQAAAGIAWYVLFDAYSAAGLKGLLNGLKSALGEIVGIGTGEEEFDMADYIREQGQDFLKDKLQDKWKGEKPVSYSTDVTKNGCDVKLTEVWDKAGGTYDVFLYGNCKCNLMAVGRGNPQPLGVFGVHLRGKVSFDVDSSMASLKVGTPTTLEIDANCAMCLNGGVTGDPPNPPVPGVTKKGPNNPPPPPPPPGTPGGTTPTTPGANGPTEPPPPPPPGPDPCTLPKPCPECVAIYDQIQANCKRIAAIDGELRDLTDVRRGLEDQLRAAQGAGAGATKKNQLTAKKYEHDLTDNEMQGRQLGVEQLDLKNRNKDLATQMKDCQAKSCGTGKNVPVMQRPIGQAPPDRPGVPKYVYGAVAAVPAVIIATGGGGKTTTTIVPTQPTTPTNTASTTTSTSTSTTTSVTTTTTSTTTSVPATATGVWVPTSCTVMLDPRGHDVFIAMCSQLNSFQLTQGSITIVHPAPFVNITGDFDPVSGNFTATGRGTVAGFPNVGVRGEGTINISTGQARMNYTMGTGGELPGGQAITYAIQMQKQR